MARGTVAAFAIRVGGLGLVFVVQVLIARTLGLSAFGEYTYVVSWLVVLALLTRFGLDTAGVRFIAAYRASGAWAQMKGFLQVSQRLIAAIASLVALVSAGSVWLLQPRLTPTLTHTAWIACLALPLFSLLHMYSASLRGLKKIVAAQVPVEILRPAFLGFAVVVLSTSLREGLEAPTAMISHLLAIAIALGVSRLALLKALPRPLSQADPVRESRTWLRVAVPLALASGLYIILDQMDIIMVGALLGTDRAGVYAAAARLAQLLPIALVAVNTAIAPTISELWAADDRDRLQRLLTVAARLTTISSLPLAVILVLGGRVALGLFGDGFETAYVPLIILGAGQMFNVAAGSVSFVMTMTGLERQATAIIAATAILNLMLNALLIPLLGIRGAAIATAVSVLGWNLAMLVAVRRQRHLDSSFLGMRVRQRRMDI